MRYLMGGVLALCIASSANASFKVGYVSLAGEYQFGITDMTTGKVTQGKETAPFSALVFGAETVEQINENLAFGLAIAGGPGVGEYTLTWDKKYTNLPANMSNPGRGNEDRTGVNAVGMIEAKVILSMKAMGANLSLGLGGGAQVMGLSTSAKRQAWTGADFNTEGAPVNTPQPAWSVVQLGIVATPGISFGATENMSLGLEAPINIGSQVAAYDTIAGVGLNPTGHYEGWTYGGPGLQWGLNLVFKKKI